VRRSPLGLLTLLGAAGALGIFGVLQLTGKPFDWRYLLLVVYFMLITFLLHRWQESAVDRTQVFIRRFMGGSFIQLFGSVILMVILVKTAPKDMTTPLVIAFVSLYALFTTFSVSRLMKLVRAPKREP
jgi:hypothetical protein